MTATTVDLPVGFLGKVGTGSKELFGSIFGIALVTIFGITAVNIFDLGWSTVEVVATTTGAVSVWLLAKNRPLGWWIGLVSVACFVYVFYTVQLYGEVGIQIFYLATSLQAIWIWVRGGAEHEGRKVAHIPWKYVRITAPLFLVSWAIAWYLLARFGGAAPMWDSLTTVMSITAHIWLVFRFAQSWWIWVSVDLIYIPLYLSRDLTLTSGLYVVFLILATMGLVRFWKEAQTNAAQYG